MTAIHSHPSPATPALVALTPQTSAGPRPLPARIELRWSCTAACCGLSAAGGAEPGIHDRAEFIISLERLDSSAALIQAVLVAPGADRRRAIVPRCRVRCSIQHDGRWQHVDVIDAGAAFVDAVILKLSLTANNSLGYVHTTLLALVGFPGGSYDRPVAHCSEAP